VNFKIKSWQNKKIVFIFGILFFLRLYRLSFQDFWYDEVWTVWYAKTPWFSWSPPFYWIFLHFWIKLFGISEFSLRFPSSIFSFLSCILLFLLGEKLFNKKIAFVAVLFMGLSPFQVWYAQEARSYTILLFLSLLSNYLFLKAIKENKIQLWFYFVMVSSLGIYINYFFVFLIVTQFFYLFFSKKLSLSKLIFFLLIPILFLPYLKRFLTKLFAVKSGFWVPPPQIISPIFTLENFILGYNALSFLYRLIDIVIVVSFFTILKYPLKAFKKSILFCFFFLLVPLILIFSFSKLFFSIYLDRGLIFLSPYLYLLLSLGLFYLKKRVIKLIIFSVVGYCLLFSLFFYYNNEFFSSPSHHIGVVPKMPIKPLVRFIEENLKEGDIIFFTNYSLLPSFEFYSGKKEPLYFLFFPGKAFDPFSAKPIQEGLYRIPIQKIKNLEFNKLWVISCNWERNGYLDENSEAVREFLIKNFKLELVKEIDRVLVYRYNKKEKWRKK
jgi:hypothetical protein